MVEDTGSGIFYARKRVQGRLVWRSLDTATKTTAKARLGDKLKEIEADTERLKGAQLDVKITFGDTLDLYKKQVAMMRLKPSTRIVRLRSEKTLRRCWPDIFSMQLRKITGAQLQEFLHNFENGGSAYLPHNANEDTKKLTGDSPTTVNVLIGFFTHIFEIGVKGKILRENPAHILKRKPLREKVMNLPNKTQWATMVQHIRNTPGWGSKAADLVEGLAYSGMRVGESRRTVWGHIDFEREQLLVIPDKTEKPRTVHMNPSLKALFLRMKGDRTPAPSEPVFQCKVATKSLAKASRLVGKPKMTHHDLRHFFATNVIEAGVDIPTLSKWLGHKDGGALAMKTYVNVRTPHFAEAAKKVSFQ